MPQNKEVEETKKLNETLKGRPADSPDGYKKNLDKILEEVRKQTQSFAGKCNDPEHKKINPSEIKSLQEKKKKLEEEIKTLQMENQNLQKDKEEKEKELNISQKECIVLQNKEMAMIAEIAAYKTLLEVEEDRIKSTVEDVPPTPGGPNSTPKNSNPKSPLTPQPGMIFTAKLLREKPALEEQLRRKEEE
ncbi:protein CIP2A-like [Cyprinodon tularosa]|uniref:protein CIP2A-like n=1 Tax=Cyprinodon tularosa TaxID=77115 RepID=UPI0018E21250|nr:protein CIP2A-like [Cyprinodon tularosa]